MAPAESVCEGEREFVVWFAHHCNYYNMRFQELEALASLVGVTRDSLYVEDPPPTALVESPFCRVRLPSEAAAQAVCERAVLIKAILEVWAEGPSFEEAVANALAADEEGGHAERDRRHASVAPPKTFQIRVTTFGRTVAVDQKREIMELLRPMFTGDEVADLRDPDVTIWAIAELGQHHGEKTHLGPRTSAPKRVFVARQVAGGRSIDKKVSSGGKAYYDRYNLTQRAVLGPTTLDNQLAFIMANCACASPGKTALEPFCGSGGIVVALSHFGVQCTAGELDLRVVKGWAVAYTKNEEAAQLAHQQRNGGGKARRSAPAVGDGAAAPQAQVAPACPLAKGGPSNGSAEAAGPEPASMTLADLVRIGIAPASLLAPACGGAASSPPPGCSAASTAPAAAAASAPAAECGRDIFTNFMQYGFPLPEVVLCDNSRPPWRCPPCAGWVDCIVTDPPYGVRATCKKQGRKGGPLEIRDRSNYIPSKVSYGEDELNHDLLDLAAETLNDNGRISFLLPIDCADLLGIKREGRSDGPSGRFRDIAVPDTKRVKDRRLVISETSRDPLLLDEARYLDFIPQHAALELLGASLQVLSGGLGRLLVTMQRRPR